MNVLLGVSGGIACYKSCGIASALTKSGFEVNVVLTANAAEFVTPLTFQALTHRHVYCEMFDGVADREIAHINLAKQADVFVIGRFIICVDKDFGQKRKAEYTDRKHSDEQERPREIKRLADAVKHDQA